MSKEIIRQLKNLKQSEVTPRPEWLASDRARLLSQIKNTVKTEKTNSWENVWFGMSIFLPRKLVYGVVKPLVVLLIVTAVGTSGWIATVDASYRALPGDWLYPAKRVVEKTQVTTAAFVGAKKTEARLYSEFAKRRADEIKTVIKSTDPQVQKRAVSVIKDLTDDINTANAKLDQLFSDNTDTLAGMAKEVQKNSEQINNLLKEAREELSSSESEEVKEISSKISEAKDISKDTSIKAMEVLVSNYLIGKVHKNDLLSVIEETNKNSANEVNRTKQNVADINLLIGVAIDGAQEQIKYNSISAELTNKAKTNIKDISDKTDEAIKLFDTKLLELKEKIENDDLAGVMDLVKLVSEKSKEINKLQDEAIAVAQTILSNSAVSTARNQLREASIISAHQSSASSTVTVSAVVLDGYSYSDEYLESGKLMVSIKIATGTSEDDSKKPSTDSVETSPKNTTGTTDNAPITTR